MELPKELSHIFYKVDVSATTNKINVVLPEGTFEYFKGKLCKVSVEQAIIKQCTLVETDPEELLVFQIDLPQPYSYMLNTSTNMRAQNQVLWKIPINLAETADYFYNGYSNGNGIICFFQNMFTISLVDAIGSPISENNFGAVDISLRITPFIE